MVVRVQYEHPPTNTPDRLTPLAISFSSSGDNTVISAVASKKIKVHRIFFVCSAATAVTIKDGASTNLTGAMSMGANGGFTLDLQGDPWFITAASNALIINQTGTAQVSGAIYYTAVA